MADAADSKSVGRKPVKVRLLSPAPPSQNLRNTAVFGIYEAFCTFESRCLFAARSLGSADGPPMEFRVGYLDAGTTSLPISWL
jgi:hypothetical protein